MYLLTVDNVQSANKMAQLTSALREITLRSDQVRSVADLWLDLRSSLANYILPLEGRWSTNVHFNSFMNNIETVFSYQNPFLFYKLGHTQSAVNEAGQMWPKGVICIIASYLEPGELQESYNIYSIAANNRLTQMQQIQPRAIDASYATWPPRLEEGDASAPSDGTVEVYGSGYIIEDDSLGQQLSGAQMDGENI
jgi:hypothetical protein